MISSRESLILIVHICVQVYGQIGGVTSWYQSQLPVGIPLSNSFAEVESSRWKTFTNMAVWLTGPRRHWVVLGSFTPRSLLSDSNLSSIRVKWFLLNLTLGSRYRFHPESPLLMMVVSGTWRPWRYSPLLTRELVFIAFAIPLPPSTLMDNYLQLLFLHSSPVGLVITRYPEILVVVSIILWAYRLAVLCHLNTPMDNSRTYRVSAHPPVVHVFHNGLWNTIRSSKNP